MNEDLEFIQSVIKEEIKSWTGYLHCIVTEHGEDEFIQEMSLEIKDCFDMEETDFKDKEKILEWLNILVEDFV